MRGIVRQTSTTGDGRSAGAQMASPSEHAKEVKGHGVKEDSRAIRLSLTGDWNDRLNERHHATRTSSEQPGNGDTGTGITVFRAVTRRLPFANGTSSLTTRRSENSLVSELTFPRTRNSRCLCERINCSGCRVD